MLFIDINLVSAEHSLYLQSTCIAKYGYILQ